MPIEKVERFYCPRCQYTTYYPIAIENIKKNDGVCPACQDGKGVSYQSSKLHKNRRL